MHKEHHKIVSSSFVEQIETYPIQKTTSLSLEKMNHLQKTNQQKSSEQRILINSIEKFNKISPESQWSLLSFDQKRTISGYKGRLKWMSMKGKIWIISKASFNSSFFKEQSGEGDIVIQLEQINFNLTQVEKRNLQQALQNTINRSLEAVMKRNFETERRQSQCLRNFLSQSDKMIKKQDYEKKTKNNGQKIDKRAINKRYMLYHSPASFSWNPLGGICINENKLPLFRKSFIGDPASFGHSLEPIKTNSYVIKEQEVQLNIPSGSNKDDNMFGWQVGEEIDFIVFNRQKAFKKLQTSFYEDKKLIDLSKQQNKASEQIKSQAQDSVVLGYATKNQSLKIKKIYQRYFLASERIYQFNRHDKLRVYQVIAMNKFYQDQVMYLIERINLEKNVNRHLISVSETVLSSELSLYKDLLEHGKRGITRFKYNLIADFLRNKLNKDRFGLILRIYIVENEFFQFQLQKYFKKMYTAVGIKSTKIHHLGSHNSFDEAKSEKIFMDLLKIYFQFQNEDHPNDIQTKILKANEEKVQLCLKIKSKHRMERLNIEWILSEAEKNNFLMKLFPLLIVKDREMEKFQFKQIKKIVSSNSKMNQFLKKVNEIITKLEQNRTCFIAHILSAWDKQVQTNKQLPPRRIFQVRCMKCAKFSETYEAMDADSLNYCNRCKALGGNSRTIKT